MINDKTYGVVSCIDTQDEHLIWFSEAQKDEAIAHYTEALTYGKAMIVKQLRVEVKVTV